MDIEKVGGKENGKKKNNLEMTFFSIWEVKENTGRRENKTYFTVVIFPPNRRENDGKHHFNLNYAL